MERMMYMCRVCGEIERLRSFEAREMMFGMRDEFKYDQCANCLSLQIAQIPSGEILQKYYPADYYAHAARLAIRSSKWRLIKDFALRRRDAHVVKGGGALGSFIEWLRPPDVKISALKGLALKTDDMIVDLGCGANAELLGRLAKIGFKNVLGVDPFISFDTVTHEGVNVRRCEIDDVEGQFDLIMMHHSFEHVPSPVETLLHIKSRLKKNGRCLIRIPMPSSFAYDTYGRDWVQLDAPRHLTLISRCGMTKLANRCGVVVERAFDDSSSFQFVASELYMKDIPLVDQKPGNWYSSHELDAFAKRSHELNSTNLGDQSCFILRAA